METEPAAYCIKIGAHLDHEWSEWFDGMEVTYAENGDTFLTGAVNDQAMLYGVLTKLCNLGLQLISVTRLSDRAEDDETAKKATFDPEKPDLET
jgi:hypothetical protein